MTFIVRSYLRDILIFLIVLLIISQVNKWMYHWLKFYTFKSGDKICVWLAFTVLAGKSGVCGKLYSNDVGEDYECEVDWVWVFYCGESFDDIGVDYGSDWIYERILVWCLSDCVCLRVYNWGFG